jgi:hypothetical protein
MINQLNSFLGQNIIARPKKYSREDLHRFLDRPDQFEKQLRETSVWLFINSGPYRRVVSYFANMLTLDYLLIPDSKKMKTAAFKRELEKVTRFLDNYNVKHEFNKITWWLMVFGAFFGVERIEGNSTMIQPLDPDMCKISSLVDGCMTYSVDMSRFDTGVLKLENYHPSFTTMYETYKKTKEKWQEVDDQIAVCFSFYPMFSYTFPPLTSSFVDLYDLDDAKAEAILSDRMANFRLLVQGIPMKKEPKSDKDLVLSAPTVKMFHGQIENALPENIAIVSTPMPVTPIDLDRTKSKDTDNVIRTEGNVFTSTAAGGVFNSRVDNSISLNRSISADESLMLSLLRGYERFFRKKLVQISSYLWKFVFLDLTIYNRNEMADAYKNDAQFGMPKSLLAAARGFTVIDIMNLLSFENDFLNITDSMQPLKSSHVASTNESGRPSQPLDKLEPKGVEQVENDANAGRAK